MTETPATDRSGPWSLEEEARQAYELAPLYCGDCRHYHLTRAFAKLSGVQRGPERDVLLLRPLLRRHIGKAPRVLIAGAGDTGLLQLVHKAIASRKPAIVIADKCRTPLLLCQRYADASAFDIAIRQADLVEIPPFGTFDLIIAHSILPFIAFEQRPDFLGNLAGMLSPSGVLMVSLPLSHSRNRHRLADDVVAGLPEGLMKSLPDQGTLLGEALKQLAEERQARERSFDGQSPATEALFEAAGLEVVERHDSRSGFASGDPPRLATPRRYLVCRPRDSSR